MGGRPGGIVFISNDNFLTTLLDQVYMLNYPPSTNIYVYLMSYYLKELQ